MCVISGPKRLKSYYTFCTLFLRYWLDVKEQANLERGQDLLQPGSLKGSVGQSCLLPCSHLPQTCTWTLRKQGINFRYVSHLSELGLHQLAFINSHRKTLAQRNINYSIAHSEGGGEKKKCALKRIPSNALEFVQRT